MDQHYIDSTPHCLREQEHTQHGIHTASRFAKLTADRRRRRHSTHLSAVLSPSSSRLTGGAQLFLTGASRRLRIHEMATEDWKIFSIVPASSLVSVHM